MHESVSLVGDNTKCNNSEVCQVLPSFFFVGLLGFNQLRMLRAHINVPYNQRGYHNNCIEEHRIYHINSSDDTESNSGHVQLTTTLARNGEGTMIQGLVGFHHYQLGL